MAQFDTIRTATGARAAEIDKGLRAHMNKVYGTMSVGMLITFAVARAVGTNPQILSVFRNPLTLSPNLLGWIVMFAPLIMVFAFGSIINRLTAAGAQLFFYAFAAVMGLSICWIFVAFTGISIAQVFLITSIAFAGLALYGYATKRDLSAKGTFLLMCLIGLFGAMAINLSFIELSLIIAVIKIVGLVLLILIVIYVLVRHFSLVVLLGLIVAIDVFFVMGVDLVSDPATKLDEQVEFHRQLQVKKIDLQSDIYDISGEIRTRSERKINTINSTEGIIDKLGNELKEKVNEAKELDSQIQESRSSMTELSDKLERRDRESWITKARKFVFRQAKAIGSRFVPDQSFLGDAISFFGVLIFAGLTAYDTQNMKTTYLQMAHASDQEWLGKATIMGALSLYLDFLNMFMFLLHLFGNRE